MSTTQLRLQRRERRVRHGRPDADQDQDGRRERIRLDADTLDGLDSFSFVRSSLFGTDDQSDSINGSSDLGSHFLAEVYLTAANFPPNGTAFASGQTLSIADNTALFSLIGTFYGGDGKTNFKLPDLRQQAPGGVHYVIQTEGIFPSRP